MTLFLLVAGVALLVLLIFLEGKRQERQLGEKATGSPNVLGSALLELQGNLEADRKVDSIQETLLDQDRVQAEHDERETEGGE